MEAIRKDLTWLQKHERLILGVLLLSLVLFLGNRWINYSAQKSHDAATAAVEQLNEQKAANAKLAEQVAQSQAQYIQLREEVAIENAKILNAIASRNVNLAKQQATNKVLPLPELAKRWTDLVPEMTVQDIAVTALGGSSAFGISDSGARATVNQLEEVLVLQANLDDTQQMLASATSENEKANVVIDGLNAQVAGLKIEAAESDKTCKLEIKDVKAQARKGKVKWFAIGFVAGVTVRFVAKVASL